MPIRIGVVDDHSIVCNGICLFFENNRNYTVVFHAYNGEDCFEILNKKENVIDVLLLDISIPKEDGFDIFDKIKEKYYNIKIIFLTSYDDYYHFSYALDIGIDGYVLKSTQFSELEYAIQFVYQGKQYIDFRLANYYHRYQLSVKEERTVLTKREKQILNCVVSGMLNKEIAVFLHIKEETVKNHLEHIYHKIGVKDRTQAAVSAIQNHYINL